MLESKVAAALRAHQKLKQFEIGSVWVNQDDGRIYVVYEFADRHVPCKEILICHDELRTQRPILIPTQYAMSNFRPFK